MWHFIICTIFKSIEHFKSLLKKHIFKPFDVPSFYLTGNRRLSLLHARLRNMCSNLNHDLFLNHLRLDSKCDLCVGTRKKTSTFIFCNVLILEINECFFFVHPISVYRCSFVRCRIRLQKMIIHYFLTIYKLINF